MTNFASYLFDAPAQTDEEILEQVNQEIEERDAVPSLIDEMEVKLAQAYQAGIALARQHGTQALDRVIEKNASELEKIALLPAIPLIAGTAARALGGQAAKAVASKGIKSMATDVGKNLVVDKATSVASNALNRNRQQAQQVAPQMAQGGFKYATAGAASKLLGNLGGQAKSFASSMGGKGPGTFGQKLVGGMVRNPGAALIGAGMVGGAVMAPRDPVTGEKQYMRGAITGGAVGGGAYALGAGNKLRSAVVNPKGPQILGERAGAYAREATKATNAPRSAEAAMARASAADQARSSARANDMLTRGFTPPARASSQPAATQPQAAAPRPVAPAVSPPVTQVDPRLAREEAALNKRQSLVRNQGMGGGGAVQARGLLGGNTQMSVPSGHGVAGEMQSKFASMLYKLANRQTLSYDPATKSMTRTHLTPSLASSSQVSGGGTLASPGLAMGDIKAGTTSPVPSHVSDGPRAPLTAAQSSFVRPSGGQSQAFSLHGGNVVSSSQAPGMAARPQTSPRPIAAPPPIPAAARAARSPIAAGAGAALRAAPKPPSLPSLAGARSLTKLGGLLGRGAELLKGGRTRGDSIARSMGWKDARIKGPRPGNHPFKAVDEHSFMTRIKNQYPGIGSRITEGHLDTVAKDQAHEALKSNALRGGLGLAAVGGGAKAFSKKSDD